MVIVPLTRDETWPNLIDRNVFAIKVGAGLAAIHATPVTVIVERSNSKRPYYRQAENGRS